MGEERPGVLRRTSQIQDFINRTGGVVMKAKKTPKTHSLVILAVISSHLFKNRQARCRVFL